MSRNKSPFEITTVGKIVIAVFVVLSIMMLASGYSFDALEGLWAIGFFAFLYLNWISK